MQSDINDGRAVLALFDRGDNIAKNNVEILINGLYLAYKSQGDSIYTAKP